jgi:hypothetical protein
MVGNRLLVGASSYLPEIVGSNETKEKVEPFGSF